MPDLSAEHQDIPMPPGYVDNGGARVLRILDGRKVFHTVDATGCDSFDCVDIQEAGNIYDCDEGY